MRRKTAKTTPERPGRQNARISALPVYSAVDLGTNNCRLLSARPAGTGLRIVDSFSRIVRLGEGVSISGLLDEAAMERTIAALKICAVKIRELASRRVRNVATEACRVASNGGSFLERVRAETGLVFEPISTDEEARLTVAGCVPLFDAEKRFVLMFDIGGGSTEVTWIEQSDPAPPRILGTRSLAVGVMTITERLGAGFASPESVEDIREVVDAKLADLDAAHGISDRIDAGDVQLLGTSGTVTTLGGVFLNLKRYDRSKVDGIDISFSTIEDLTERLCGLSESERAGIPCIGHQRADLMIAGCTLLQAICSRWKVGRLTVADRGIREGLLFEMMSADGLAPETVRIPSFSPKCVSP